MIDFIFQFLSRASDAILQAASQGVFTLLWVLLSHGGWLILLFVLVVGLWVGRLRYLQAKYRSKWNFTLLAIDIPKGNEQSPKAVEQIFAHIAGAQSNPNLKEKYIDGKVQEPFSFEIISIGGHIQFLVRIVSHFRDLIESAIYAQYPDAEITEVEDYTYVMPHKFPDIVYDIWGTDFDFTMPDAYPIRTYEFFENQLTQDFKDPLANLMEILTRMKDGEQVWLQLVLDPIPDTWKYSGTELINKILRRTKPLAKGIGRQLFEESIAFVHTAQVQLVGLEPVSGKTDDKPPVTPFSPVEVKTVEAIQKKISKIGFLVRFRLVYLAKKEVMNKPRGVAAVMGALKTFSTQDFNAFRPNKDSKTAADYFFVNTRINWRKRKMAQAARSRKDAYEFGGKGIILNIEELATLWHFPVVTAIRTAMVKRIESKKSEAPASLPLEETFALPKPIAHIPQHTTTQHAQPVVPGTQEQPSMHRPPDNLPIT